MELQSQPSKIARLADSGFVGSTSFDNGWKIKANLSIGGEGSPPIGLGLELGRGSGHGRKPSCPKSGGFTFLQLQELEHQALIFKYIQAGFPVPYHLVLPIWKSVAASFGLSGGQRPPCPSFLGVSPFYLDSKNNMDPEPGRCRRTDGKKWRCSKEAVPDQKYCERHMHRGRQRSRKHVEAAQLTTTSNAISTVANNANTYIPDSDINLSISLPLVNSSSSSNNSNINVFPRFGFSSKSVLQEGTQKTEPSL